MLMQTPLIISKDDARAMIAAGWTFLPPDARHAATHQIENTTYVCTPPGAKRTNATRLDLAEIVAEACKAADAAADRWLMDAADRGPRFNVISDGQKIGTMLDVCGAAHVCAKGSSRLGRWAKSQGEQCYTAGVTLPITYRLQDRQEWGLHRAAAAAAREVFKAHGLETALWSYID